MMVVKKLRTRVFAGISTGNVTINDDKTSEGGGSGSFASTMTGLDVGTAYFVRAYATNKVGTAYGQELSFDTEDYTSIWTENFESYALLTFPSTWIKDANAYDISTNFVTDVTASEGGKSLKLYGMVNGCWASIIFRSLETTSPYIIEIDVKNGDESLSGCHPDRAIIALKKNTTWQIPGGRALVQFYRDGYIYLAGDKKDSYTTNTWYKLKIQYEIISSTEVKLSFWINNDFKGDITKPIMTDEDQFTYLEIAVEEGTAWVDNIRVLK